ncbi:glycosyltransferase [Paucibacter sp. B2R-40]|uniref:glycosyltransferase n=1 Tax=Paucibacter sp. B2R-40 TaxID=2893554 RepID=UPI0021E4CF6A|nr:glycosyltransferase [Paucibacter sp. B2R-40]MCV2355497.1 glycosyltransferase [Paucibacter sp. B2R-40]
MLMVAYHFPPLSGSSGIQRTLRFVQQLPAMGWNPLVLTAHQRAYEHISNDLLKEVPIDTLVVRAQAWDTARHLNLAGRYLSAMARPDRWVSWQFDAIRKGMQMVVDHKPDLIWSTYPIATAHLIASKLSEKAKIPWVADFRDPMAQVGYPADPKTWQSYTDIEGSAAARAKFCVFTTPGAASSYAKKFPSAKNKILVLENGFDEESFLAAEAMPRVSKKSQQSKGPIVLLHSGIVYPAERDPTQFFQALANLLTRGVISKERLKVRFRAAVHREAIENVAKTYKVLDLLEFEPAIPYVEALQEMMSVDALLVMQGRGCNAQIPAKIYEYLRAGKPIIGLTDPAGDTASVLLNAGLTHLAELDSVTNIERVLSGFLDSLGKGTAPLPQASAVKNATRSSRSRQLAVIFDEVLALR